MKGLKAEGAAVERAYRESGNSGRKAAAAGKTRKSAVAGSFYPANKAELEKLITGLFAQAKKSKLTGKLKGLVVPHAGYIYSGVVAASAYLLLQQMEQEHPEKRKIIIIGPSHFVPFKGIGASGAKKWETPLGTAVTNEKGLPQRPKAHGQEHSIEVQVPFLQSVLKKFTITPIVYGNATAQEIARICGKLIDGNTIIIASSDLSHYYQYEDANDIDSVANKAIPALDIGKAAKAEACGIRGILALMLIAKKGKWKGKLLDYRNSGDTAGSKDSVVGYGAYAFYT